MIPSLNSAEILYIIFFLCANLWQLRAFYCLQLSKIVCLLLSSSFLSHTSLTPKRRWKPQVFSPCNFPCLPKHRARADGDAALCPHVCTYLSVCYEISLWNHVLNLEFALWFPTSCSVPFWCCIPRHCAMFQPLFTEMSEPEMNLNITDNNSSTCRYPTHTLQLWSQGPVWWSLRHPSYTEKKHSLTLFYPASLHTYTQEGMGGPTTGPAVPDSLAALGPTFPHSRELCSSDILEQLSSSASNAAVMVRERERQRGREGRGKRMRQAFCVLACYAQSPHSSLHLSLQPPHLESLYSTLPGPVLGCFGYITFRLHYNVFYHALLSHTACDPVYWMIPYCTIL